MKRRCKNIFVSGICVSLFFLMTGCSVLGGNEVIERQSMSNGRMIVSSGKRYTDAKVIQLSEDKAVIDGDTIEEFDYTWNCDPGSVHDEVKDAPAEFYTGTKPDSDQSIYIDHELYYYPLLEESQFQKINYDGEQEWAYYYTDGTNDDYIFATLPVLGQNRPTQMMHSSEEAAENKVLHINEAGTYVLKGSWKGQINVDLGEESFTSENEKVTLILDGADIECSVAPGIIFNNVYECDNGWEDVTRTDANVDTTAAGANIVLADDSQNYISGTNVFRMLKKKYKDENSTDTVKLQKKMRKTDGALYSYMTMNIDGNNGILIVDSGFEGIDSELHLTVNGGNITVNSQDDGMNVNEDHVSVISFLGGEITINAALGAEGDGVDSNGYIAVNGGTIAVNGIRVPDSALDSEDGIYYDAGKVVINGQEQSYEAGTTFKETREDGFGKGDMGREPFGGGQGPDNPFVNSEFSKKFDLKEFKEKVANLDDDATYEDVLSLLGIQMGSMGKEGMPDGDMQQVDKPEGMPEMQELDKPEDKT